MRSEGWVTYRVPGTCGELCQGVISGQNFLITCPVNLFSFVSLRLRADREEIFPPGKWKSAEAVRKVLKLCGERRGFELVITSEIPPGKGMASSTADVVGAILCASDRAGYPMSAEEVARVAVSIEPSDGTMFDGIAVFDHLKGGFYKRLGLAPEAVLLVIDDGGRVDTFEFNKVDHTDKRLRREREMKMAVALVEQGVRERDITRIAQGATISAFCNQDVLFKPHLSLLWEMAKGAGAHGICVAHSGNVVGAIFEGFSSSLWRLNEKVLGHLPGSVRTYVLRLISGGGERVCPCPT